MDSNNMFQNMPTDGPEPGADQTSNYSSGTYQDNQTSNYGAGTYQDNQASNYGAGTYQGNQTVNYGENAYQGNNAYNQNTYTNPNYQAYQYNNNSSYQNSQMDLEEPVKVGEWLITMLILLIPCVNIIMMFVWAFSSSEKKSKSNYFKATLIWFAIVMAIYLVLAIVLVAAGASIGRSFYY